MDLLKKTRHAFTQHLWHCYKKTVPAIQTIEKSLQKQGINVVLDHFAIIDLPSPHSGIPYLSQLFSALGYSVQGLDYLPEKQNDFLWLVESDAVGQLAKDTLPQVVVADFRLHELPLAVKKIIDKYIHQIPASSLQTIQHLSGKTYLGDKASAEQLLSLLIQCFSKRAWSLPTIADFKTVQAFNELLAWVLLFGAIPNHFTIAAHLLNGFDSMVSFMQFIETDLGLELNTEGGIIKGNAAVGIEQGSTVGVPMKIQLADGDLALPGPFIEFVWRYPLDKNKAPLYWQDYYSGFIAQNANKVIESVYG
jgi:hypothetical protein